jgi:hypothetical protein
MGTSLQFRLRSLREEHPFRSTQIEPDLPSVTSARHNGLKARGRRDDAPDELADHLSCRALTVAIEHFGEPSTRVLVGQFGVTLPNAGDRQSVREVAQIERDPEAPCEAQFTVRLLVKRGSIGRRIQRYAHMETINMLRSPAL